MTENVIRPRTKAERMALLTGYAMAIEDVEKFGLGKARDELRFLLEHEDQIHDEQ